MIKRIFSLLLGISFLTVILSAAPVDTITARKVALNFFKQQTNIYTATPLKAELVAAWSNPTPSKNSTSSFYIFNVDNGFVIVSGDDKAKPILAFSDESAFDMTNIPENLFALLNDYAREICTIQESVGAAASQTACEWRMYKGEEQTIQPKSNIVVGPLVTSKWAQTQNYNALCPADPNGPGGHAQVGCIAVVMGQIMRYWKFPTTGSGSYGYTCNNAHYGNGYGDYGYLEADFEHTTYDYEHMPNKIGVINPSEEEINAVATLLFHCGIGAHMRYGSIGSMANTNYMVSALTTYFRYESDVRYVERSNYSNSVWLEMMKTELDSLQPFCYGGSGPQGGHAFLCDGYRDDDYFHVNWGWEGSYNGYFLLSAMSPGPYSFNSEQAAVIGIRGPELPNVGVDEYQREDALTIYPNPSHGRVFIHCESADPSFLEEVRIFDLSGRLLKIGFPEANSCPFDVTGFAAGTYLLQADTKSGRISKKIIIQ